MKKLKPFYVNFTDVADYWGIRLPSEAESNNFGEKQWVKELALFSEVVKSMNLAEHHNIKFSLSHELLGDSLKYLYFDDSRKWSFAVVYDIDKDTTSRLCEMFTEKCVSDLGYQWESESDRSSVTDETYLKEKEVLANRNSSSKWIWISVAAVLVCISIYFWAPRFYNGSTEDSVTVIADSVYQKNIPGKYSVYREDVISLMTAEIRVKSEKEYQIIVIGDYEPVLYDFMVEEDGSLSSVQLGSGVFEYKEKLNKTELIFNNNNAVWKFKK